MLCLTSIHRKKYQSNTLNGLKALNSPLCEEYKSTIVATTSDFRHVVRKCGKREEVISFRLHDAYYTYASKQVRDVLRHTLMP